MPPRPALWLAPVLGVLLTPGLAAAYGALVADPAPAIEQKAARVLLADRGDGTVTAVVELTYDGDADHFGWIVPVPGVPEVHVGSAAAFDRLQSMTSPVFQLDTIAHGLCTAPQAAASAWPMLDPSAREQARYDTGDAGALEYLVVDGEAADTDAGCVLDWLADAGIATPGVDPALLDDYLARGYSLVAVRLRKDHDAGAIRPLVLTYAADTLTLPLVLSADSADSDVPVLLWVLGPGRAVPTNYATVELDQARVDWFAPTSTYHSLVGEAADEAGGHGFVTELSAPTEQVSDGFLLVSREQWGALQASGLGLSPPLVDATVLLIGDWDGFEEAVRAHAPEATDLSADELLACISCVVDDLDAFVTTLFTDVIEPVLEVQDLLLTTATVTRLYTRLDASEMTVDPVLGFNADLAPVSHQHMATGAYTCDERFVVELPDGEVVRGDWDAWPQMDTLPAARRILQHGTSGPGLVIADNGDIIDAAFPPLTPTDPDPRGTDTTAPAADTVATTEARPLDDGSSIHCTVASKPRPGSPPALAFAVLVLLGTWRGRRRLGSREATRPEPGLGPSHGSGHRPNRQPSDHDGATRGSRARPRAYLGEDVHGYKGGEA